MKIGKMKLFSTDVVSGSHSDEGSYRPPDDRMVKKERTRSLGMKDGVRGRRCLREMTFRFEGVLKAVPR